jgi:hypothetical protein
MNPETASILDTKNQKISRSLTDTEQIKKRSLILYKERLASVANKWLLELENVELEDRWDAIAAISAVQELAEHCHHLYTS